MQFLLEHADKLIAVAVLLSSIIGGAYLLREDVKKLGKRMSVVEEKLEAIPRLEVQVETVGNRVGAVEKGVTELSSVLVMLARYDERMNAMDKRTDERFANVRRDVDLLRRGEGFVLPIYRGAAEHGGDDER